MYKEFDENFLLQNSLDGEEWRDVKGWDSYMVSNIGRVYSKKRKRPFAKPDSCCTVGGIILKNIHTKRGYVVVPLNESGKRRLLKVHRLVATAFLLKVDGLDIINHKDGDKTNNVVTNLEWCNQLHNNVHALRTGLRTIASGERSQFCKYKDSLVLEAIEMHNNFFSVPHIAEKLNISKNQLHSILNRKSRIKLTKNLYIRVKE